MSEGLRFRRELSLPLKALSPAEGSFSRWGLSLPQLNISPGFRESGEYAAPDSLP